jgi:RNA polymerase sigma factor (sigma-70 family)
MPDGQLQGVVHYLRRVVAPDGMGGVSDAELLERFVRQRDEAAFELLVWRHGKMVLGVCRRLLRHEQDAEDSFQAVFLALARRAAALGRRECVGGWLYRVASHIALRARAAASRRSRREQACPARPVHTVDPVEEAAGRELRRAIDEEVNRLPAKYRVPFVLCHLDGRSNAEAARELGCPVGTVESWLARARRRLRDGLARRGVVLPAGMFAAEWTALTAPSEVSAALATTTARAAFLVTTGQATVGLISVQAAAWAEGALRTMYVSKLKIAAVVLLSVGLTGSGIGRWGYHYLGAEQPGPAKEVTSAPKKGAAGRMGRLIRQLGSERFAERELAAKELDKIGSLALEPLREAAQSADPEVRRRAAELADKIEQRQENEEVLRAQRVHLRYKDTPLYEALRDFQEKCGYPLSIRDADGKLKKRKVTLDTGEVTFWEALDQFCKAAGLVEEGRPASVPQAAMPLPPGWMPPPGAPAPPGAMPQQPGNPLLPMPGAAPAAPLPAPRAPRSPAPGRPMPPPAAQPVTPAPPGGQPPQPAPAPRPYPGAVPGQPAPPPGAPPAVPAPPAGRPGQPARVPGPYPGAAPGQPALPPGATPAMPAPPGAAPGQPVPPPALPVAPRPGMPGLPPGAMPGIQLQPGGGIHLGSSPQGSIILCEGKSRDVPTTQAGAIRFRILDKMFGPLYTENYLLALQIAAEPKIGWRKATALHIDKAVDDRGQILSEAPAVVDLMLDQTRGKVPVSGSLLPLLLKKGEKSSKSLKELKGRITAEVLSRPKMVLTVDDVLKAEGKAIKLPQGGTLKVTEVNQEEDRVTLKIQFVRMPEPRPGDHDKPFALTLVSDKGHMLATLPELIVNGPDTRVSISAKLPDGLQTAKLVFSRRHHITVDIPFAFKDVPLP